MSNYEKIGSKYELGMNLLESRLLGVNTRQYNKTTKVIDKKLASPSDNNFFPTSVFCRTFAPSSNSGTKHTNTKYMQIKGMNGESYNVTGAGQGNYNTVGASAGIASFLGLNAGNILGGCGNGYGCRNGMNAPVEVITSDDKPISRYEAKMMQELSTKDGEIALLKADKYTDEKIVETTAYLMNKINEVSAQVQANKDAQTAVNMEQAVYNGTNTATIGCIKSQVAQLQALSELVIPQRKVCDTCCGCGC